MFNKFISVGIIFSIFLGYNHLAKCQTLSSAMVDLTAASIHAISSFDGDARSTRNMLSTLFRNGQTKLREVVLNRSLNDQLRINELQMTRKFLKNQLQSWRDASALKIHNLEKELQNSIDILFEKPLNTIIYTK